MSVQISEGDNIVTDQKTFVFHIQVVLLEFVHFILAVAVLSEQSAKVGDDSLLTLC